MKVNKAQHKNLKANLNSTVDFVFLLEAIYNIITTRKCCFKAPFKLPGYFFFQLSEQISNSTNCALSFPQSHRKIGTELTLRNPVLHKVVGWGYKPYSYPS